MEDKFFQIAIDGPVAAGKSTVARELAKATEFVYVDTGAMYRAVALTAKRQAIGIEDEEQLVALVRRLQIDVRAPKEGERDGRLSTVLVDGEDVSWAIRKAEVSAVVAQVASLPRVREVLVPKQRKIALASPVVMEGRDITYVVLPDADLKIYLTAKEEVRVERYYAMLKEKDPKVSRDYAAKILRERDELDATRETSPLRIVPGAWVLDSSNLTITQVVETIVKRVEEKRGNRR